MKTDAPYGFISNLRALRAAGLDMKLHDRAVRIYAIILSYADKNGQCFPSITKIAEKLGVTRQAVQKQIRLLIKSGYLKSNWQTGRTNTFQICQPIGCIPPQPDKAYIPATQSGCPKKPLKKTDKETKEHSEGRGIKHKQRYYYQDKAREATTGISKEAEKALGDARDIAHQGLNFQERLELDLDLQEEARKFSPEIKKQHEFLLSRYSEIAKKSAGLPELANGISGN